MFDRKLKQQDGFGMIELLVTIVILGFGIFALMNLMATLVRADRFNSADMISLNLAREGVEVVRNLRDGNWLKGETWEYGLADGSDYTAILNFNPQSVSWSLDFSVDDISDEDTRLYFNESLGIYNHMVGSGLSQSYRRLIILNAICHDTLSGKKTVRGSGQFCLGTEDKVGVEVHSLVRWDASENGVVRDREVVTTLLNWR